MKPVKASDIKVDSTMTDKERRSQIARKRVAERQARAEALRRNGAGGRGSAGLQAKLESRLADMDRQVTNQFRARQAVKKMMRKDEP